MRVLLFVNALDSQQHEFTLKEALPRNANQLLRVTRMSGGLLWQLFGTILAFKDEAGFPCIERHRHPINDCLRGPVHLYLV